MPKVSWGTKYYIRVEDADIETVHHLRKAVERHLEEFPMSDGTKQTLVEFEAACRTIVDLDERD